MAISPDGAKAYVTNFSGDTVSVIDIQARQAVGSIPTGEEPFGIAFTPDGKTAYAVNYSGSSVTVIDAQTNQVKSTIPVAGGPWLVAVAPDQSPIASFTVGAATAGKAVGFDGGASSDPDGVIASFEWSFGDGTTATSTAPSASHKYKKAATYTPTLTVVDNEGCSAALVFTGRTAYCSGAAAVASQQVKVNAPNNFKFGKPAAVTLLAAKILLSPLCVVAVSLVGRRWGVAVAGVLGGLPVVAGPILLVETLLHGSDFGADAAAGTLLGLAALTAFVVVYGRVAAADGPVPCVLCGWAAFLFGVVVLSPIQPPAALSLVLVAVCFALGLKLLPPAPSSLPAAAATPWWDLPARALAALGLVFALTAASGALGPHLSGLLAPFPVIASVLAVFTHAQGGIAQLSVLLRNFLFGFYGFAAFCFTLAIALPALTAAAAFGLATAAALAVQATTFLLRSRLLLAPSTP